MSQQTEQARAFAEHDLRQAVLRRVPQLMSIKSGWEKPEIPSLHHHDLADHLLAAVQSYTHDANMAIIARVLQLPQELRDNIYMYLWGTDEEHDPSRSLLYWWDSFDEPWFSKDDDLCKSRWLKTVSMNLRPPHFIDKSFVGPVFAKEALKRFKDTVGKDLRPIGEKNPVAEYG
ncbi:uncharacterized protein ALTATR162_LOCUS4551 [Alternaria atra]|nr:uncharacterized protein ALTATR162_LOCUS4551 [Alternaria atra]CAG5156756.1 unnamed protein product [Alternaria atra]